MKAGGSPVEASGRERGEASQWLGEGGWAHHPGPPAGNTAGEYCCIAMLNPGPGRDSSSERPHGSRPESAGTESPTTKDH